MAVSSFLRLARFLAFGLLIFVTAWGITLGQSLAQAPAKPSETITILPDRILMPPDWPSADVSLTDYQVKASIKDNIATTTVTQVFKNNSNRTLEARYLFPLPPDANFSSFNLTVNGKTLEGKILEKEAARQTYQAIVRKLVDPGLLEYIDDKTVQASIAPFFAGETKTVKLSYSQLLSRDGGLYKYSYYLGNQAPGTINHPRPVPLHAIQCIRYPCEPQTPKPMPPTKPTLSALTLDLNLKTSQALKTIYSPTHDPKIVRQGDQAAAVSLSLKPGEVLAEKNFVLYFSQANGDVALNTLNYRKPGENGYFLMTVRSPDNLKTEVLPKDVVLVLDTSGSMSGEKIKQAKEALKYIIQHLRPEDRFGLLQFNTDVSAFKNELVPVNPANRQAALDYVETLEASGSTNIEAALKDGFGQLKNHDPERPAYVIFLTDGEPTVGITDTDGLVKTAAIANQTQAKLFNFGVGYNLNTLLLNKLSDTNHGSTTFVEPNENLELAMTGFYKKIEAPVLTDTKLNFEGFSVQKMYPEQLGDLFAGSEVILLGRYQGSGHGTVKLSGKVGNTAKSYTIPVQWDDSTSHGQLPRLWAGRRIAYLLENIRQHGENNELKDEVISLSKQYGIITPYTSFLAVEPGQEQMVTASPGKGIRRGSNPALTGTMLPGSAGYSPPAAPMASKAAMDASSGQGAVQFSKRLKAMQNQASAQALNAAQTAENHTSESETATIRTIDTKTFLLSKEGIWTDTAYEPKTMDKPVQVGFGTDAYFKLLTDKPELARYFSLGEQVIVMLDGRVYQVLPAAKQASP
jgi:Ca-activated chloride channel family protein